MLMVMTTRYEALSPTLVQSTSHSLRATLQFQERFLKKGEEGGKDAADEFLARIKDYLKSSSIYADDMDIMVRAYANLKGLAQACFQSGKLKHAADLGFFAVGFTKRQALFDFVDVGAGKERADYKIRGIHAPSFDKEPY